MDSPWEKTFNWASSELRRNWFELVAALGESVHASALQDWAKLKVMAEREWQRDYIASWN